MTIEDWTIIGIVSGVATAVFTLIGVLTSLYMSIKAIREIQKDRRMNRAPYLAFEPGGQRHPIQFNRLSEQEIKKEKVDNLVNPARIGLKTKDNVVTNMYHGLKNYGSGPAIHAKITWIPNEIRVGSELFKIDKSKLSEAKYSRSSNRIPASPSHILPNQEAKFFVIPAFIRNDFEKKITKVTGIIEIECLDIFRQKHNTFQKFYLFTEYSEENPHIHFTFSDIQFEETDNWA